jgi:hypothetical protein
METNLQPGIEMLGRQVASDHRVWIGLHQNANLADLREHLESAATQCEEIARNAGGEAICPSEAPEPLAFELKLAAQNDSLWTRLELLEALLEQVSELEAALGPSYPLRQLISTPQSNAAAETFRAT